LADKYNYVQQKVFIGRIQSGIYQNHERRAYIFLKKARFKPLVCFSCPWTLAGVKPKPTSCKRSSPTRN